MPMVYGPGEGCQAALDAYCEQDCTPKLGVWRTVARIGGSQRSSEERWRCYASSALTDDRMEYRGRGSEYCTRHQQLLAVLEECRGAGATPAAASAVDEEEGSCAPSGIPRPLPPDHPWARGGYTGAVLSRRPLVVEVDDFLSAGECQALIAATKGRRDQKGCDECGMWWMQETNGAWPRRPASKLLLEVEERIANLTGIADHAGEVRVAHTRQHAAVSLAASPLPHLNLPRLTSPRRRVAGAAQGDVVRGAGRRGRVQPAPREGGAASQGGHAAGAPQRY